MSELTANYDICISHIMIFVAY